MFKKQIRSMKQGIDVVEYHNARYGAPGMSRRKRKKPTPEQMDKVNQYNREKKCRQKIMEHFQPNDYFSTLTCRKDDRPSDMQEMKKWFSDMIKEIRKRYRKLGYELKWIRNIEVGTRGAWHIHMIINRIPETDIILREVWTHGKVVNQLMYDKGGYRQLAAYITKTPKTDQRLADAHYYASRNLPLPDPEVKEYRHWKTWNKIRIPDGYYVDPESFYEGENPITGYPCRRYTLLRLNGMSRSIIEGIGKECLICGAQRNLHEHHIMYGTGKRKKSEQYGLKAHLCMAHHAEVHQHPNEGVDLQLKILAQGIFEEKYSHALYMAEFGKNYL